MNVIIFIVLLLIVIFSLIIYLKYRLDNIPDKKNLEAAVDAEINKAIKRGLFPGVVVGIYKDGRQFIKGYGTVRKETSQVPDATTIFQIGSISKVFTASLLQVLCDDGVVSMESTLGELIGAKIPLSSAVQAVTLRQLVTHTSGFPRIPESFANRITEMAGADNVMLDPYCYLGPQSVFEYLATAQDKREPGRFEYSNFGMGLLGHVLEIVTGRDYESLVAEKILVPLGMSSTAITRASVEDARVAQGYTAKGAPTPIWTFAALAGAGAYSSTAEDMLKFIQACVGDQGLFAQLFQEMRAPQFGGEIGIGWMQPGFLDRLFGNRKVLWHNGMVGGYASYLSIDEETKSGVVILTNRAIAPDMLGMMLMRQVRTQSWSTKVDGNIC